MTESVQALRERLAFLLEKVTEARDRGNIGLAESFTEMAAEC